MNCPFFNGCLPIIDGPDAHFTMAVCPFSAASLPIIAKLPAHLPLPVFLSKGRQPAPLQSSVGNLEGSSLPRNPVKTEVANNKKCCYWAFYFVMLMILLTFAS